MHGRVKVRTTAQEQEAKRKEREQKLKAYKHAMSSVFRKREDGELDEEMLGLTSQLLVANPDIYTLWNIRKEIFQKFKTEMSDEEFGAKVDRETSLTEQCLRANPKSYGAWYHRGWVLDLNPNADWKRELALCTKFLSYDERNFHCWDYRRLAVERSKVTPEHEFDFSTVKIEDNFSNYSSWHYRSKLLPVIHPDPQGLCPISPDAHRKELEMVQSAAFTDPNDTSAWFYQRWLLGRDCSVQHKATASLCLAWLEGNSGIVVYSKPSNPGVRPQIFCGNQELLGDWKQASSYIWVLQGTGKWPPLNDNEVKACAEDESIVLTPVTQCPGCFWAKQNFQKDSHSPSVQTELEGQLSSCQQLLQFEPDSKWTLLTSVLIMQAIDSNKYHEECLKMLDKLPQVDSLRTAYYNDLRSKYIIENQLTSLVCEAKEPIFKIRMTNCKLTALYYMHLLVLVQNCDLSNNDLTERCLSALNSLQRCSILTLDNNKLQSLRNFPKLTKLCSLSVKNNLLTDTDGVITKQIKKLQLPSLYELCFDGNPCENVPDIVNFIANLSKNK